MERSLLLRLFLVVVGVCSVSSEGEACLGWAYGTEPSGEAFRCVKERDGEGSQFCCGSCALPYCCSSEEDRLDQAQCASESRLGAAAAASKWTRKYKDSEIFGFIALALIAVVCCFYFCICCFRHRDRLPYFRPGNQFEDADPSIRLSVIDRRPDDGTHASTDAEDQQSTSSDNDPPPSYERCVNPALLGGGEQRGRSTVPWDNDPPPSYDELSVNPAFLGDEEQQSTTALLSAETPAVQLGQAGPAALESEETHLSPERLQAGTVFVEPISETSV
ncbi:protein shisa-2-like [Hemicordylus capensis]|uniref:protein shisa-2-like n=1 Tax=Hemicordylus capensis TaxID=884348 RepID=UPI002304C980|nr:protein shisa-2-like [Hemicordylus capensis]